LGKWELPQVAEYFRVLKYPLIVWLIVDFFGSAVFPILVPAYVTITDSFAGVTLWSFPLGAMAAYKTIEFKGTLPEAMVAGLITGLWCAILGVTDIGITSTPLDIIATSRGLVAFGGNLMGALPFGFAFFVVNFMGAIIGAGYALTRRKA
jgi:hypothetical protein